MRTVAGPVISRFYESLIAMQHQVPAAAGKKFTAWTDKMTAAVLRGEEPYFLGAPDEQDSTPPAPPRRVFRVQPGVL